MNLTSRDKLLTSGPRLTTGTGAPPAPGAVTAPAVLLTFDDGSATHYSEVYAYMHARNLKGTLYVCSTFGHITDDQLAEMNGAGWDIANHTSDHTDLTTLTQAQIETKLTDARDWLNGKGLTRASRHVGYPYGRHNATVFAAMTATGMLTGRTVTEALANLPPVDVLDIPSYTFDTHRTLAQAKTIVDSAVSGNKILSVYMHNIASPPPGEYDWSTANFEGLIDYLVALSLPTITINEYCTGYYA